MADTMSHQQLLRLQYMRNARRQVLQQMAVSHGQQQATMSSSSNAQNIGGDSNSTPSQPMMQQTMQPLSMPMGSAYDDLPIDPNEFDALDREDAYITSFESACEHGPLSTVQSIVSMGDPPPPRTRSFLHQGLVAALSAGNTDIARYILSLGAPIVRLTPMNILSAPSDQQLPLFELLLQHGWTVNTPGYYGAVILPEVVDNLPLLQWCVLHGADPNLGRQRYYRDRLGGPDTDWCAALEVAAGQGNVAAVRMLLDAGAKIQNGYPLHSAAGACPPGTDIHTGRVRPSKEFDESRIPVMALLVERGADVNQAEMSRHMVPRYAIVHAVMAGAVERVRWLLEHGADPELKGAFGSAMTYAKLMGSEEMKHVVDEMVTAKVGELYPGAALEDIQG